MTDDAIRATFADVRPVRTRKVIQLVFEVPVEGADHALAILGGFPNPASEVWAAIARLANPVPTAVAKSTSPPVPHRDRRQFSSLPLSQQAGILCADKEFQRFMNIVDSERGDERASEKLKRVLVIKSRSELDDPGRDIERAAWSEIVSNFRRWSGEKA